MTLHLRPIQTRVQLPSGDYGPVPIVNQGAEDLTVWDGKVFVAGLKPGESGTFVKQWVRVRDGQ